MEVSPFEWPTHDQVLEDLWFDETGRLWVQHTGLDAEGHTSAGVHGREGEYLFTAAWAGDVALAYGAIRGDSAWGLSKGPFGVEVLVALRFPGLSE